MPQQRSLFLTLLWLCPFTLATGAVAEPASTRPERILGDPVAGQRKFIVCRSCHSISSAGPNVTGPNLFGVYGRQAGTVPGYAYSLALKRTGIIWTGETLDRWTKSPKAMVGGTKEHFSGLPNANDRADIVAFLKTAR